MQISDASGCIETDSVLINEPNSFVANYSVTNAYCAGINNGNAKVTLSGGNPPYVFSWSNGDTGDFADGLPGGYARVHYTDQNGCQGTDSVNIIQMAPMISSVASVTHVSCNGADDGEVTVNPVSGGAPPYNYSWSNGDNGLSADSLRSGTAVLTITDVNNCFTVVNAPVNEPPVLVASATSVPVSCDGNADGKVIGTVSGGTAGYFYSWYPNGGTDIEAEDLAIGKYVLTVTDMHNCTTTAETEIIIGECDLELPTGFSPDGDGINDSYIIHGLWRYPNTTLKVFNRWGNLVYSKDRYVNGEWHGQNNTTEELLPDGTYFVMIDVKGADIHKNSYIDLRRQTR